MEAEAERAEESSEAMQMRKPVETVGLVGHQER